MKINPNDVVFTPAKIAKNIITLYDNRYGLYGKLLDPCKGEGVFYKNFPAHVQKAWCEITKGRDFFNRSQSCDWIVSNPPYSIFKDWLAHSFELSDHVVYLIPISKIVASKTIMTMISSYGGIVDIRSKWSGRDIGFPFGFPCGTVYIQRGYKKAGKIYISKGTETMQHVQN